MELLICGDRNLHFVAVQSHYSHDLVVSSSATPTSTPSSPTSEEIKNFRKWMSTGEETVRNDSNCSFCVNAVKHAIILMDLCLVSCIVAQSELIVINR